MGRQPLPVAPGIAVNLFGRIAGYAANPDPQTAACNMIALVVAWNQPLYPAYVAWLVGGDAGSVCWTFLSTPFFLAVPLVARRSATAGRILLPVTGITNTVLSAKAFGTASGVELFLLPCILIALLAFRLREWRACVIVLGCVTIAACLHPYYGAPLGHFSDGDYGRFAHLNAWSVAILCGFVLWRLGSAIRSVPRPPSPPNSRWSPRRR